MPYARQDEIAWLPGHYYHIYNRGARRLTIFREEANYLFVLHRMKKYCKLFTLSIIAYCLMPNHYHFLVRQNALAPAGWLAQRTFNSYSKAYNKLYQHSGTLFEGRFKAVLVGEDRYLRHLCYYIHANPVKDGITRQVEAWPYSNYLEWTGQRNGTLVDHDFVHEYFGDGATYAAAMLDFVRTRSYLDQGFQGDSHWP